MFLPVFPAAPGAFTVPADYVKHFFFGVPVFD